MLIKTQDNKTIINIESVNKICVNDNYKDGKAIVYAYFNYNERTELGRYENSERAMKILDSIGVRYEEIERSRFFRMEEANFVIPTFNMPEN